jgi:hypothetical protein
MLPNSDMSFPRKRDRLRLHTIPFFKDKALSEITPGLVQAYRVHRTKNGRKTKNDPEGKPPSRSSMHQEIVALRRVLKCANRHGWLPFLPDLSAPYKASGMAKPDTLIVDGHAYSWQPLCQLRHEQLET